MTSLAWISERSSVNQTCRQHIFCLFRPQWIFIVLLPICFLTKQQMKQKLQSTTRHTFPAVVRLLGNKLDKKQTESEVCDRSQKSALHLKVRLEEDLIHSEEICSSQMAFYWLLLPTCLPLSLSLSPFNFLSSQFILPFFQISLFEERSFSGSSFPHL